VSEKKPWFKPNSGGIGVHPATWQGWAILIGIIAVLVCVVVLFRTHVL